MRIGLLVSDTKIKIVLSSGKKIQCIKVPLESGIVDDGVIKEEEKFKNIITKLGQQINLTKGEVVFGISERHVFSKIISVPEDGELEEKINSELEQYIPSAQQSHFDWQKLEKKDKHGNIFFASIPSQILDPYLSLFHNAGINLVGIEPLSLSLARHVPKPLFPSKKQLPAKTKDKAQETTKQQIAAQPETDVPVGVLILEIDDNEALITVVNSKGYIELTSVLPKESVSSESDLLSEISDMRIFYDRKNSEKRIGRILLTGEHATDALAAKINSTMGLPTELLRIPTPGITPADAVAFFTVFALTDLPVVYTKDHKYINLLPQESLEMHEQISDAMYRRKLLFITTIFFSICSFIYIICFGFLYWQKFALETELEKDKVLSKNSTLSDLRATAGRANRHINLVNNIKDRNDHILEIFTFLEEKTPGGITINQYTFDITKNTVVLNGTSLDREILLGFKQLMEDQEEFQNVKIPLSNLEKRGASTFSISFEVKGVP